MKYAVPAEMSTTSSYLNTQLNNSPRNVNPGNKNMDFYLLKYPIFTDKLVFGSFSYLADPRFVVTSKFFPLTAPCALPR